MRKESWSYFLVALALMGGAAGVITYYQAHQRLGTPAVKVVPEPVYDPKGQVVDTHSVALPAQVLDYEGKTMPVEPAVSDWLPKDTVYGQRLYTATNGISIGMTTILMGADRTSIHKAKFCLEATGWTIDGSVLTNVAMVEPYAYELPVMKVFIHRPVSAPSGQTAIQRALYVYWFVADKELTAVHGQRLWWLTRDLLCRGILQRWAYISCLVAYPEGQEDAACQKLTEFLRVCVPQFQLTHGSPKVFAENSRPAPAPNSRNR
jgi:hypothetical protein